MKKRIFQVIAAGILLGLILLTVRIVLGIDEKVMMDSYWKAAPLIVIAAVVIYMAYLLFYQKKMQKIALLLEKGQTEEYVAQMEALLRKAKGRNLRNILKLNLAAAYMEAERFEEAVPMLEELSGERLGNDLVRLVHRLDLCLGYFHMERRDQALEVYETNRMLFERFRAEANGGNSWKIPRLQEAFRELEQFMTDPEESVTLPEPESPESQNQSVR